VTACTRIDVRELNASLQSLARSPILSAFRYQRTAGAIPGREARREAIHRCRRARRIRRIRHGDGRSVTAEGRPLTEVVLELQNRAQPF